MPALLAPLLIWVLSSAVARVLFSLGLGIFTYKGIESLVETALDQVSAFVGNLPEAVIAMLSLSGCDTGLSIIGSALLTRAAVMAARVSVGLSA